MPRESHSITVTLPDRDRVRDFIAKFNGCRGQYTFTGKPSRLSVSQELRGYFHGHVVAVFAAYLKSTGTPLPEEFPSWEDFAKAALKHKCLQVPVYSRGGEVVTHIVGSTEALSLDRYGEFVEDARKYMWDEFELFTDDPDPNWKINRREPATAGVRA